MSKIHADQIDLNSIQDKFPYTAQAVATRSVVFFLDRVQNGVHGAVVVMPSKCAITGVIGSCLTAPDSDVKLDIEISNDGTTYTSIFATDNHATISANANVLVPATVINRIVSAGGRMRIKVIAPAEGTSSDLRDLTIQVGITLLK